MLYFVVFFGCSNYEMTRILNFCSQELTVIINLLDPEGRGVINFPDFCEGIKQILDIQQQGEYMVGEISDI